MGQLSYRHPIGEVFSAAMPGLPRQGQALSSHPITEKNSANITPALTLNDQQQLALDQINQAQGFSSLLLKRRYRQR